MKTVRPQNAAGSESKVGSVSSLNLSLAASSAANAPPLGGHQMVKTTVRKVPVKKGNAKISKLEVCID
jgi:hypothetical protein